MKKRILSLLLSAVMLLTILPLTGTTARAELPTASSGVLRVGTATLTGYFSPFFSSSVYDGTVVNLTNISLLSFDREGRCILRGIEGETRSYNGTDYTYYSPANCDITENDDGSVDYLFTLRDDLRFSDGVPVTIDDVLFSLYVLCDPNYDGSTVFSSLPIEGLEEYCNGVDTLFNYLVAAGRKNTDFMLWTEAQQLAFWADIDLAGERFAQSIIDLCLYSYVDYYAESYLDVSPDEVRADEGLQVKLAMFLWGYEDSWFEGADAADFWNIMLNHHGGNILETSEEEKADQTIQELMDHYNDYLLPVISEDSAPSISGITKVNDNALNIHMTELDQTAIYSLSICISPLHYFGDPALFNGIDSFGFPKGDLRAVREKNDRPLGAGPYVFESWEDGVLTLVKNPWYYEGEPKIERVQLIENVNSPEDILSGEIDITDITNLTWDTEDLIRNANGGSLTGKAITTRSTDYPGYGYIGINANLVMVGNDPGSEASRNLRKGFATVLAANREEHIKNYYSGRAKVIEYPISNTSWAAPKPKDPGYEVAFSRDVNGAPIYSGIMGQDARNEAALQAAIGYFQAAGFTWDGERFTDVPDLTVKIPGDDHPAYYVVMDAAEALSSIGVNLSVDNVWFGELLDSVSNHEAEGWAMAWGSSIDPDMYQIYHSDNISPNGTCSNHYCIADAALDSLIYEGRYTADQEARKVIYRQCLDIILDWGVEIPLYQRKTDAFFSTERIRINTLTPNMTTYWSWINGIEKLELASDDALGFQDVRSGKYYFNAVLWALTSEPQITKGTDDAHFSPNRTCNRAQVVTFLWNAMGQPEPDLSDNPFTDVKSSKYFYKAVLWAYQNGITKGADDTHFNPNGKCNRAQVVSFLWNAAGKPEPNSTYNPFGDVKQSKYYYKAVLWAVEQGITKGTDETHFSPNTVCSRAQVVTFLFNSVAD